MLLRSLSAAARRVASNAALFWTDTPPPHANPRLPRRTQFYRAHMRDSIGQSGKQVKRAKLHATAVRWSGRFSLAFRPGRVRLTSELLESLQILRAFPHLAKPIG
jgi:hypothetical protein